MQYVEVECTHFVGIILRVFFFIVVCYYSYLSNGATFETNLAIWKNQFKPSIC